ncbi:hypothetical protein MIR68_002300 [Amoeboaphelidium protococcarum]|nr:hypothetical protein MIR68_002300 [Amoeboaphelidium protococcarum]
MNLNQPPSNLKPGNSSERNSPRRRTTMGLPYNRSASNSRYDDHDDSSSSSDNEVDNININYNESGDQVFDRNNLDRMSSPAIISEDMCLRERQNAINQTHPFGIRLWKPALYKKTRTIEQVSYDDVHRSPSFTARIINPGNVVWSLLFGWWIALVYFVAGVLMFLLSGLWSEQGKVYTRLLFSLSSYMLYPFGRFVERVWDLNDWEESGPLLASPSSADQSPSRSTPSPKTLNAVNKDADNDIGGFITSFKDNGIAMGDESLPSSPVTRVQSMLTLAQQWLSCRWRNVKRMSYNDMVFYCLQVIIVQPVQLFAGALCWLLVFSIPMAKLSCTLSEKMWTIPKQLRVSPLLTPFSLPTGEILICTYNGFGSRYYKYTVDGVNIIFINLIAVVLFALVDGYWLAPLLNHSGIANPGVIFMLCVVSVLPLAYFIGMAVASISSQSSFGFGAVINATFSSIVEIILYWMAIRQNKGLLVEGAIIGSFIATLLLLPGLSMISGGVGKWKEQKFNVKSASVSMVLLYMALIGAFTPTLFYSVYGKYEFKCDSCHSSAAVSESSSVVNPFDMMAKCSGCTYELPHNPNQDPLYVNKVKPLMYFCAAALPSAYLVGLLFTLRTHVKQIYHADTLNHGGNRKHDSQLWSYISTDSRRKSDAVQQQQLQQQQQLNNMTDSTVMVSSPNHTQEFNMGASAGNSQMQQSQANNNNNHTSHGNSGGGHEAPEWSKTKSAIILLVSTVLFALLAEKLVDTVDSVIEGGGVSEKFLGLTLFAIVPSFTEFLNAIAFAMYGNVSLSLEIGCAYVVQIALIQIPILVGLSAFWNAFNNIPDTIERSFTLIFPRWDLYTVFFAVFLLSYTYIEGKSNYFKGSILTLSYLVLIISFYYAE